MWRICFQQRALSVGLCGLLLAPLQWQVEETQETGSNMRRGTLTRWDVWSHVTLGVIWKVKKTRWLLLQMENRNSPSCVLPVSFFFLSSAGPLTWGDGSKLAPFTVWRSLDWVKPSTRGSWPSQLIFQAHRIQVQLKTKGFVVQSLQSKILTWFLFWFTLCTNDSAASLPCAHASSEPLQNLRQQNQTKKTQTENVTVTTSRFWQWSHFHGAENTWTMCLDRNGRRTEIEQKIFVSTLQGKTSRWWLLWS